MTDREIIEKIAEDGCISHSEKCSELAAGKTGG